MIPLIWHLRLEQKLRRTHPVKIYSKNIFDSLIQFFKSSTKNELFNLSKTSTLGKIWALTPLLNFIWADEWRERIF